jgi:hypothetical protein
MQEGSHLAMPVTSGRMINAPHYQTNGVKASWPKQQHRLSNMLQAPYNHHTNLLEEGFNLPKQLPYDPSRRFSLLAAMLIFLVFLLTVYLSRDFLFPVMMSVVLVFLLKPLFSFFSKMTGNRMLSSALSILAVVIVMLLVLLGMTQTLFNELSNIQTIGFRIYPAQNASQDLELWLRGNFEEPLFPLLLGVLKQPLISYLLLMP